MEGLLTVLAGFFFGFSESTAGSTPVVAHAANQSTEQAKVSPQELLLLRKRLYRMQPNKRRYEKERSTVSFKLRLKLCCLRNNEFLTVYFDGRRWECFHPVLLRHLAVHVQCDFEFERIRS